MTDTTKLHLIKLGHSAIWTFFNVVIFYLLYAVIADRIDGLFWSGLGLVALEALVLLIFQLHCPLTVLARRYSDSQRANFDIFLPEWLARNNKTIYTGIMGVIITLLLCRMAGC